MNLTDDFLLELFKACIKNKRIFETAQPIIKYNYLPNEQYKNIWKEISDQYDNGGDTPTLGLVSQRFEGDKETLKVVSQVRDADLPNPDKLTDSLKDFAKTSIFLTAYDKMGDLYNQSVGDVEKKEALFKMFLDVGEEIHNFKMGEYQIERLMESAIDKIHENAINSIDHTHGSKSPFGIPEIDDLTFGGNDRGDIALILAQSGVGKTKALRHIGVSNVRRGRKVLHVQLEGSHKECVDGYIATLAGENIREIEFGSLGKAKETRLSKAIKDVKGLGGEIFIKSVENGLGGISMIDIREAVISTISEYGGLDVLIIDYMGHSLIETGDGKRYGTTNDAIRQKLEVIANEFKRICVEFKVSGFTAAQASTVDPDDLNDPKFVQSRYNVSEFKGIIKPFSYFFSLNQTDDESRANIIRIYLDKMRKYKANRVVKIYTAYDNERFIDQVRTRKEFFKRAV